MDPKSRYTGPAQQFLFADNGKTIGQALNHYPNVNHASNDKEINDMQNTPVL